MCVSGVDIQHLTIWAKLFKSRRILICNDYLIPALLLRSWTSVIFRLIHKSTLQDDIFLSCWSAGQGMCVSGVDVQHLTGSADLFNHGIFLARCFFNSRTAFKILNISDYCTLSPLKASGWQLLCKTKTSCCIFNLLNISDYLYTFTNQRFRMTFVMQKRKPHAAFLRSWISVIIAQLHHSTLQDDSCYAKTKTSCCIFNLLNISDYLTPSPINSSAWQFSFSPLAF